MKKPKQPSEPSTKDPPVSKAEFDLDDPWNPSEIEESGKQQEENEKQKIVDMKMKLRNPPEQPIWEEDENQPTQEEPGQEPRSAETKRINVDEKGQNLAAQGSYAPPPKGRPGQSGQPMVSPGSRPTNKQPEKEQGSLVIAKSLGPQLGTDPEILGDGRWDERKLAVLTPYTLTALSHFSHRFIYDGVRYWGHITEWELSGSQGVNGLGRQHILKAIQYSSGVQPVATQSKPNVITRNIFDRHWKEKAMAQGKDVEE
jgi:hypothetical protein